MPESTNNHKSGKNPLAVHDLAPTHLALCLAGAFIIGFSKTGVGGLGIVAVTLMASVFPAKASTGIILPALIFADIFAIAFYRHHVNWRVILRISPFVIPGIIVGFLFMDRTSGQGFGRIIGVIILSMLLINVISRLKKMPQLRKSMTFTGITGLLAGFVTMTANAAGPIMAIYLLSMDLDKRHFVGSRAWYFFLLNCIKVPFSASLGLISFNTLRLDIIMVPMILIGAVAGYFLIKILPQKAFELVILVIASLGAIRLIVT